MSTLLSLTDQPILIDSSMDQLSPTHSLGDSIELVTPSDSSIDTSPDIINKLDDNLCHLSISSQPKVFSTAHTSNIIESSQYLEIIQQKPSLVSPHHPWWILDFSSPLYQVLLKNTISQHNTYIAKRNSRPKLDLVSDHEERQKRKIEKLQLLIKSKTISVSQRKQYTKLLYSLDPQSVPPIKSNKQSRRDNRNNKGQFRSGHSQLNGRSTILTSGPDSSMDIDSEVHWSQNTSFEKGYNTTRRLSSSSKKTSKVHTKHSASAINLQRRATPSDDENRPQKQCASCSTQYSPAWRPSIEHGLMLCNSCGLRLKKTNQFCNLCLYIPLKVELVGKRKDKIGVCKKCHYDHSQPDPIKKQKILDSIKRRKRNESILPNSLAHKLLDHDLSNNPSEAVSQLPSPEHV